MIERFSSVAMGSHHLEYGFPSTHSTNSVSMALYMYSIIYRLRPALDDHSASALSPLVFHASTILLVLYAFSIVFGRYAFFIQSWFLVPADAISIIRLYCAMHSFTDCIMGVTLGSAIAAAQWVFGEQFEIWKTQPGWTGSFVICCLLR